MTKRALPRKVEASFDGGQTWQPAELTHVYDNGSVLVELPGYVPWRQPDLWREL